MYKKQPTCQYNNLQQKNDFLCHDLTNKGKK